MGSGWDEMGGNGMVPTLGSLNGMGAPGVMGGMMKTQNGGMVSVGGGGQGGFAAAAMMM